MKRRNTIVFIISIFLLVIGSQNCSEVGMNDGAYIVHEKLNAGGMDSMRDREFDSDPYELEAAIAKCEEFEQINDAVQFSAGQSLRGERSNLKILSSYLGIFSQIYGSLHLIGTEEDSYIEAIQESVGDILICGMDVGSISKYSTGNLIVVRGNVGDISDLTGNLILIGGTVTGRVSNAVGAIRKYGADGSMIEASNTLPTGEAMLSSHQQEKIESTIESNTVSMASAPNPGSLKNLQRSGPIVLQSNRTYSNLRVESSSGSCFFGEKVHNVRIINSEIGPCGKGKDPGSRAVTVKDSSNIKVENNIIHDVATGMGAIRSRSVVFSRNYVYKLRGPFPSGQLVQFDKVSGPGNKITCNVGAHTESDATEDSINVYKSNGTKDSYIEIAYNRLRGGKSKSGSGIMVGDGKEQSSYIDVHHNTLVNVNNVGIGVAGGKYMKVRSNRIYNNGKYTGVGLSIRNYYPQVECKYLSISDNQTWAYNRVWGKPGEAHFYRDKKRPCSDVRLSGNTWGDRNLTTGMFDEAYPQCR